MNAPKFGTPDWHAQRAADIRRIAARSRYRRRPRSDNAYLEGLRAEFARLTLEVATFAVKTTPDGKSVDQRLFELTRQIREAEALNVPRYAARAATAASSRVPGEDDE